MSNQHRLQAAPELQDKDESIYQALMTAIVEHQLPPGEQNCREEALAEVFGRKPHRDQKSAATTRDCCKWSP
ncbi:transcriptional regulator [Klebsiella michiganensis]|uniref:Transcriptional regulator n=1 Tax=Klebsiella michiganensis TaxID=1134687 RepID=A0A7H4N1Z1_9ENTR|nr:transcriptional regulator [Klebsiella michiganensis]